MKRRDFVKTGLITSSIFLMPNWVSAMSKSDLPNVLIIGDSISIGYTPFVKKDLEGIANVYRPLYENGKNENCQGTTYGLQNIDKWIGMKKWDLIHFNFGLHDLKHVDPVTGKNSDNPKDPYQANLKQYKKNLFEIVKKLKNTNSNLVFATTTPYPDNLKGSMRDPGLSKKYNKVAIKVMKKNNILINDLYGFVLPKMEDLQIPQNVHFTETGSETIGKEVAQFIRNQLNNSK
jgi:lysophospholipase L1-like esterase